MMCDPVIEYLQDEIEHGDRKQQIRAVFLTRRTLQKDSTGRYCRLDALKALIGSQLSRVRGHAAELVHMVYLDGDTFAWRL